MSQKGLGTGLGALFGADALENNNEINCQLIPLYKIEPNQDQARKCFDEEALAELAESIAQHGVIQPLTVRKLSSGNYQIIAGERRWRASKIAGISEVPARIIDADDRESAELSLIENLQREDLNPIEEANGYSSLIECFGLSQEEAAEKVGKARTTVTNALRLLQLPIEVQEYLLNGNISAGHGRALLGLKNKRNIIKLTERIINESLSVRSVEKLVKVLNTEIPEQAKPVKKVNVDYIADIENRIGKSLGRKVKLTAGKKRGKIELEYYDEDDREKLINMLINMGNK